LDKMDGNQKFRCILVDEKAQVNPRTVNPAGTDTGLSMYPWT